MDADTSKNVALDLSCVNDVDARGLGLLAGLVDRARGRGTTVSVIAASRVGVIRTVCYTAGRD
jgi:ABC-type transporter Mla MlaB component